MPDALFPPQSRGSRVALVATPTALPPSAMLDRTRLVVSNRSESHPVDIGGANVKPGHGALLAPGQTMDLPTGTAMYGCAEVFRRDVALNALVNDSATKKPAEYLSYQERGAIGQLCATSEALLWVRSDGYCARSTDSGETWSLVELPVVLQTVPYPFTYRVAVSHNTVNDGQANLSPERVILRHPYGVVYSDDHGATWTLLDLGATAASFDGGPYSSGRFNVGGAVKQLNNNGSTTDMGLSASRLFAWFFDGLVELRSNHKVYVQGVEKATLPNTYAGGGAAAAGLCMVAGRMYAGDMMRGGLISNQYSGSPDAQDFTTWTPLPNGGIPVFADPNSDSGASQLLIVNDGDLNVKVTTDFGATWRVLAKGIWISRIVKHEGKYFYVATRDGYATLHVAASTLDVPVSILEL